MSKIAIVTDSTANIPPELLAKYNITVAPLVLIWGDDVYEDGVDIQPSAFYDKLITSDVFPTTSQATVATFTRIFKELTEKGFDILTIVLSSKLSGLLIQPSRQSRHSLMPPLSLLTHFLHLFPLHYSYLWLPEL